jgi:hypothetical protein
MPNWFNVHKASNFRNPLNTFQTFQEKSTSPFIRPVRIVGPLNRYRTVWKWRHLGIEKLQIGDNAALIRAVYGADRQQVAVFGMAGGRRFMRATCEDDEFAGAPFVEAAKARAFCRHACEMVSNMLAHKL